MNTRTFTAAAVERMRAPASGQIDHFDHGYPGLALRVSYGGAKAWVYFYRLFGKQKRLTLGRWPSMSLAAAREAWRDARHDAPTKQQAIAAAQWLIGIRGGLSHEYSQEYWRFSTKAELRGPVETDERFLQGIRTSSLKSTEKHPSTFFRGR